jgi:hypothetical protein
MTSNLHWKYEYEWARWDKLSAAGADGWRVVPGQFRVLDGDYVYLLERMLEDDVPDEG